LFLFEIQRADGSLLKAVDHDTVLQTDDVLWFAGDLDGVAYLQKYTTLEHMQADQVAKLDSDIIYRRLVQVRRHNYSYLFSTACICSGYSNHLAGCRA
jgi:hypothetical protein